MFHYITYCKAYIRSKVHERFHNDNRFQSINFSYNIIILLFLYSCPINKVYKLSKLIINNKCQILKKNINLALENNTYLKQLISNDFERPL